MCIPVERLFIQLIPRRSLMNVHSSEWFCSIGTWENWRGSEMFFLINAEKKKGIIYSKIDDWPREITFIVTVRKCLVEVFANNEYSGLRQVAHIVVKSSWSCFLFFDISAGRKSGLITFSDHSMNKHLKCQVSLSSFKQWRQQKWNFFKDLIQTLQ